MLHTKYKNFLNVNYSAHKIYEFSECELQCTQNIRNYIFTKIRFKLFLDVLSKKKLEKLDFRGGVEIKG